MGVVFQRPILYPHLSVKDNILFPTRLGAFAGRVDMDYYRELLEALKLEGLEARKPSQLSGGQAQRVGIARAMYRNPSLLVMDEATSALDNETEYKITQTINRISKEITVIIVAHRLSTVRNVDQLVYLSQGRIANKGTFKEVQMANEEFANLVRLGQLPD